MVRPRLRLIIILAVLLPSALFAADTFRVATYNVENYLEEPTDNRPVKSEAAKAKVCEAILLLKPDVLALEEMGTVPALMQLQSSLKSGGLDLPYWEHISGSDPNIHVAILSKFPIVARRPHTNDNFLLGGRRFWVSRGFAEVDIQVDDHYSFTLIAAHLKSKVPSAAADEAELRLEEARLLREIIDTDLADNPNLNLVVLGDFNDTQNSQPIKTILGARGQRSLVDTRPAEQNGDDPPNSGHHDKSRRITWTEYYAWQDTYDRIDYILLSHAMARKWDPAKTYILTMPNWGAASDHRPLVATFDMEGR